MQSLNEFYVFCLKTSTLIVRTILDLASVSCSVRDIKIKELNILDQTPQTEVNTKHQLPLKIFLKLVIFGKAIIEVKSR